MLSIKWCLRQKKGIGLIEPNGNMSKSYLNMAEESIDALNDIKKGKIWVATASYYIFYYSLYALMMRIGIKCEIHACSLLLMQKHLTEFYDSKDVEMINKAFSARIDLQYYSDRPVDSAVIDECRKYCKDFFIKTKDKLSSITEDQIESIREDLEKIGLKNG